MVAALGLLEKTTLELNKDATYSLVSSILQNSSFMATYLHLTNYPSKMSRTGWACSPMDSYIMTHKYWPFNKKLHSSALWGHWVPSTVLDKEVQATKKLNHLLSLPHIQMKFPWIRHA